MIQKVTALYEYYSKEDWLFLPNGKVVNPQEFCHALKDWDLTKLVNVDWAVNIGKNILKMLPKDFLKDKIIVPIPGGSRITTFLPTIFSLEQHCSIIAPFVKTGGDSLYKQKKDNKETMQIPIECRFQPKPKNLLFFDDVVATGSTIKKCAELLDGGTEISVFTLTIDSETFVKHNPDIKWSILTK